MIKKAVPPINYPNSKSRLRRMLPILLGLIVASWVIGLGWEANRKVTYVIPAGTGTGDVNVEFPDEIILTVGLKDTVVIENRDHVVHSFGPFVIGPNSTLTKRFKRSIVYEEACTFHQNQQMRLVVNPAPWDIRLSGDSAIEPR